MEELFPNEIESIRNARSDADCSRILTQMQDALPGRLDVPEKNQPRTFRLRRKFRFKAGKNIQLRLERMRDIQVVFVAAVPAKCLAIRNAFEIGSVDVVARGRVP